MEKIIFTVFSAVVALTLFLTTMTGARAQESGKSQTQEKKDIKVVFVAGPKSHGYMAHEHYAGCKLLADKLEEGLAKVKGIGTVKMVVCKDGWPKDTSVFNEADAIVMFCDGGGRHMVIPHLKEVDALAKKGVGIACLHYGVEVPKGEAGDAFLDWTGGHFETWMSVNPHWTAESKPNTKHAVGNGVKPFAVDDEWYYHMRFRDKMEGVTPVLSAVAPESTLVRKDGPHSGNPHVRKSVAAGEPQHLAWARQRPDGGRGFGFTGGHWHWLWANDDFRKINLNGIAWIAGVDVPERGIDTSTPTMDELEKNQDYPTSGRYDRKKVAEMIKEWNK